MSYWSKTFLRNPLYLKSGKIAGDFRLEQVKTGSKSGMILVFVLTVMILISLMGVMVMVLTSSEVAMAGHQRRGQEAFYATDSALDLSNLLGRIVLHPVLGHPQDLLTAGAGPKPQNPLTVEINHQRFSLENLISESEPFNYLQRYLDSSLSSGSGAKKPHVVFKIGKQIVAAASFSLDYSANSDGFSLSAGDRYDLTGGFNRPVDVTVTVTGTSVTSLGSLGPSVPRSVITTIRRDHL
ncbi:MAG: pilus assembly PilX N-terminal domain-containing protein [Deltaproteobacteria bacterium]|jgi:hypothetical protein|nr:pilus assembly PilX N-terminal domain-containing protein [Deltaproteobacteria bacterium]